MTLNKAFYKKLSQAILKKATKEDVDFRPLMREWIMLFESTKVKGWNRDEFLDCMVKEIKLRKLK